jgi:large subunit ribosomal protein L23
MDTLFKIIQRPVVTERATALRADANKYVFRVAPGAAKQAIRLAVEKLFKVQVTSVNTMNVRGKFRKMGAAPGAYRPTWKKAIVTVKAGQEIKMADEPK